jgi:2'-5' RNA ligase
MSFAVLLYFDNQTEKLIRAIWKELAETEIAPYLHQSPNRPHIKLAIFEDLNLMEGERRLKALAAVLDPMPVIWKQVGIFPNPRPTVFLGPVVTSALLELQGKVEQGFQDIGIYPSFDYFVPGQWVPHCLLAMDLEPAKLLDAVRIGMHLPLPFTGKIVEIGVIEFYPVQHRLVLPLGEKDKDLSQNSIKDCCSRS